MSRECGKAWKELSEDEKLVYKGRADVIRDELRAVQPVREKKPVSNYLAFAMSMREGIAKENPDFTWGQVSKQCGALWKALPLKSSSGRTRLSNLDCWGSEEYIFS